MIKRYCDRCGQQIDEGVHAWYVLELHGTDGEFRHKELCEECYEYLCEKDEVPKADRKTENCSEKPNNCDEPQKWETPPKFEHKEFTTTCVSVPAWAVVDEPQTDGYMTAEQAEDYRKMLDKAEHKVYGNIEDEPQTIRCPKCGRNDCIREFGKDFSVTAEKAGFKYKCINCNTYIEPQTERRE